MGSHDNIIELLYDEVRTSRTNQLEEAERETSHKMATDSISTTCSYTTRAQADDNICDRYALKHTK